MIFCISLSHWQLGRYFQYLAGEKLLIINVTLLEVALSVFNYLSNFSNIPLHPLPTPFNITTHFNLGCHGTTESGSWDSCTVPIHIKKFLESM